MVLLINDVSLEEITVNNSFLRLCLIAQDRHDLIPHATDGCHHTLVGRPTPPGRDAGTRRHGDAGKGHRGCVFLAVSPCRRVISSLVYGGNSLHFDEEIGVEEALDDDQRTGG